MRRVLHWCGAAALLLLVGMMVDTRRAAGGVTDSPLRAPAGALPGAPLASAVVLQRTDCTGNLRMLDLLHRADLRERLALSVLWYVGPATDTIAMRQLLPAWTTAVPLRPVPPAALHHLRTLGHRSTPILLLYDQEGRVRLTSQSPRSPREFAGLRRALEGLTWIEEL